MIQIRHSRFPSALILSAAIFVVRALLVPSAAAGERLTVVAWAPGYPGTTEQAQPSMDELAGGVAAEMGIPLDEVEAFYHPELDLGRARLLGDDVAIAIVPLPVLLEYGEELKMRPLLTVELAGVDQERWSLVAKKGAIASASDLSGWRLEGLAGYSSTFVRAVLSDWGTLPSDVEIAFNGRVVSVLRKAAKGEQLVALLDEAQAGALDRLPFGDDLEVLAKSGAVPSSYVCVVGDRLTEARAAQVTKALLALNDSGAGKELLSTIRVDRFGQLDEVANQALDSIRRQWRAAR
jgi:hypothetical protein